MRIRRQFAHLQVTFVENTCESGVIDMREFNSMQVSIPAAWTEASLGVKVSPVLSTTFKPLWVHALNASGSGAHVYVECASIGVSQAYAFPYGIAGAGFVRLWSQKAGADADQGAERILGVTMKG